MRCILNLNHFMTGIMCNISHLQRTMCNILLSCNAMDNVKCILKIFSSYLLFLLFSCITREYVSYFFKSCCLSCNNTVNFPIEGIMKENLILDLN